MAWCTCGSARRPLRHRHRKRPPRLRRSYAAQPQHPRLTTSQWLALSVFGGNATNIGMQRIHCVCGLTHRLTPTSMAIVIDAFTAGELHTVDGEEIKPLCVLVALA